jgi:cbb3-type cytochrome oxidase subunit 3
MSTSQWLEHYMVAILTVLFIGIVAVTYWPGRKKKIEQQGMIPFEDDV